MSRKLLLLACFALSSLSMTSCTSAMRHLGDARHPWHSYPMIAVTLVGATPALPVAAVESTLTGASFHGGVVTPLFIMPGLIAGTAVGAVTYLALFPLEFAVPHEERESPVRRDPPDEPNGADSECSDTDLREGGRVPSAEPE